jgi:hypothetical protein
MRVDLHVHTYPSSTCSSIAYRDLIAHCREHAVGAIALTNHGDVTDNRRLAAPLAEIGTVLVHGVEVSTLYGDFLVYSPDLDLLAGFARLQGVPEAGTLPADAAVVWAHPVAGGGLSGSPYYPGLAQRVAGLIDAVEVWNGNWLEPRYSDAAAALCAELGLPAVGGSDAHVAGRIETCVTEIDGDVRSTADVVAAIKSGAVAPVAPRGSGRGVGALLGLFRR